MALTVRQACFDFSTSIDTCQLYPTSRLLADITGIDVQPNKAIVGRNAFAHEAGIHQDGVLKNPLTYEIMTPESVGVPGNSIVLGKHSGRRALAARLKSLGYALSQEEINVIYQQFTTLADRKKNIHDDDLRSLIKNRAVA